MKCRFLGKKQLLEYGKKLIQTGSSDQVYESAKSLISLEMIDSDYMQSLARKCFFWWGENNQPLPSKLWDAVLLVIKTGHYMPFAHEYLQTMFESLSTSVAHKQCLLLLPRLITCVTMPLSATSITMNKLVALMPDLAQGLSCEQLVHISTLINVHYVHYVHYFAIRHRMLSHPPTYQIS